MIKDKIKLEFEENYLLRKSEVKCIIGGKTFDTTLGAVFLNLLILKPLIYLGISLVEGDLFSKSTMTQGALEEYFNYLLERIVAEGIDYDYSKTRDMFIKSMNEMCDLSGSYNVKVGNSISYRDFLRMEVEDPEAEKLFKPEVVPGSFSDIEGQFNAHGKKLMKYLREHESELKPFVCSETGINSKQLTQCIGFVGLKPDMDGSVIPVTIADNFLNGLSGLESYFINCKRYKKGVNDK